MSVITMLTDFGTRDPYVGIMKGVILGIDPGARLVDLTHEIEPGDIAAAGFQLATAWRWFPPGTVHLAVVDPGVGSERRPLAAMADGHWLVGPDNGLFTAVLDRAREVEARELASPDHRLSPVSRTFHGRDVFAPAAAWLSRGGAFEDLGPLFDDPVRGEVPPAPRALPDGTVRDTVVHVDVFGNLVTSVTGDLLESAFPGPSPVLAWGDGETARLVGTYAEARGNEVVALVGSSGYLEIAVNGGSAARKTGLERGDEVRLLPAGRAGGSGETGTGERTDG